MAMLNGEYYAASCNKEAFISLFLTTENATMIKNIFAFFIFFSPLTSLAQENMQLSIADSAKLNRSEWQSLRQIETEQKRIDFADGIQDNFLNLDEDMTRSKALSNSVFKKANQFKFYVLNNFDNYETKRNFLNTIVRQLRNVNRDIDRNTLDVNSTKRTFNQAYNLARSVKKNAGAYYIKNNSSKELYELNTMLDGQPELQQELINATAQKYPELLFKKLKTLSPREIADKVVLETAKSSPKLVLNFATSTAVERDIVRRNQDQYVKDLVTMADNAKTPLKAIYFLPDFNEKKLTMAEINKITSSKTLYFKKLVVRMNASDKDLEKKQLTKELHQETKYYVQQMNELHFASGATRFKVISPFSADEMYYIITEGDEEFYTSSYMGVFNRFMGKLKPKNGYQFLEKIKFNQFRTFIRLCGNFNTLTPFLKTLKSEQKESLLKMFVGNLEGDLEKSLEGAIDVATTYSSSKDTAVQNLMIEEVQRNKNQAHLSGNNMSYRIYNILNILFTADDSTVSARLNVPPIASLPYSAMQNDSGVVVQQLFFPGDKDGKGVFNGYKRRHSNGKWKFSQTDDWVVYESKGKNKIIKYANKPKDEPNDELAQKALEQYLMEKNLKPSIIVQRGHSYHVATTLDQLKPCNKVIMLGACGGFNHLETIMSKSPDAQIISSKQVGSGSVNWPILDYMDNLMLAGKDIDWIKMWSDLGKRLRGNALFDDYVPPHKNLGSLFLKAFYRAELEEVE